MDDKKTIQLPDNFEGTLEIAIKSKVIKVAINNTDQNQAAVPDVSAEDNNGQVCRIVCVDWDSEGNCIDYREICTDHGA